MESIISTFHIDWKIIIAQAINFGVVFAVLYVYALKPLSKLMRERGEKIQKGVEDAKTNATLVQETRIEYEKVLASAKVEANKIFQEGKKEAEAKRTEMMEATKVEVATMIAGGKKMLETEKVKMVEDAKREIVELAAKAVEKLLKDDKNAHQDAKTIKELNQL